MLDTPSSYSQRRRDQALLSRPWPMFIAAIEQDASLPKPTRDGLCCSIRRVAKFLERDLAQLPARLGALRYGIARLHHAQLGISREDSAEPYRQPQVCSSTCGWPGALERPWHRFEPAPGRSLYDQLTVRRLRLGLSGFLRYCSATGIDPSSVSDDKRRGLHRLRQRGAVHRQAERYS